MANENTSITSNKFICENCDFKCSKKGDYNRHILTDKHERLTMANKITSQNDNIFKCECSKEFKHSSSLSKHKKKCTFIKKIENNNTCLIQIEGKKEMLELKEDNKELKNMIKELIKENAKHQLQIGELIPKIGNTTNNTQNNNQKFNINVFLNEDCKNAINMSDFIKSLHITIEQLDFTKQNGLAQGLSKSIIENMNKLSIYERPMHCTDTKRETLYIKDNDNWSKDGSKEKIKSVINKASSKNFNALMDWKKLNPDYMNSEDKTDYFTKTISTIGKPTTNIDEKIIKNLCKETYVKES